MNHNHDPVIVCVLFFLLSDPEEAWSSELFQ